MAEGINIEQIVQEVLDRVLQSSTGVEDMETVTSLTGVKSLPGQKGDKLVNVPFEAGQWKEEKYCFQENQ